MTYVFWLIYVLAGWWAPWWSLLLTAGLVGGFSKTPKLMLRDGFAGGFLTWFLLCLLLDVQSDALVSSRLAKVMSLPGSWTMLLIVGLMAGAISLIASILGYWLKCCLQRSPVSS
ncbi:MAG: hypothetical protein AB7N80_15965 [Bdellovibrionales bacterium]